MKIKLLPLLLLLPIFAKTQPLPCVNPATMTSFCDQACIICDIDGFTGINNSTIQGQAPPGFCTTQVHHMQWIGFIAGTTNLTLQVHAFNCQNNEGLEIGIYGTADCENFQLVSNCNTNLLGNTMGNFTNIVPLVVGQYYYFVMDGSQDDVCNYTVTVLNGSTQVSPLSTSGTIAGDGTVCPGISTAYTLSPPPGATTFSWTLNGSNIVGDTAVFLNWTTPGQYNLCVTASNVCDTAPPACRTIFVNPIPPTNLSVALCDGECYQVGDSMLCAPGFYSFHFTASEGCDSLVTVNVTVDPPAVTNLDLNICSGDSIVIGTTPYLETGHYQQVMSTYLGCDSIVNLNLTAVVCEIKGEVLASSVGCKGDTSGVLTFRILDGTAPFTYVWERIGQPGPSGSGNLSAINTLESISHLPAGTYIITVNDNFGNDVILIKTLTEPLPLVVETQLSDFYGFNVSCKGSTNGFIQAIPGGGTMPYFYQWSIAGNSSDLLGNLGAGQYSVTVTDANNCTQTAESTLIEPDSLSFTATFKNPACEGLNTGSIHINSATGGVPPYSFALSGTIPGTSTGFEGLSGGNYTLTLRDTNGCMETKTGTLVAPLIPVIDLGPDVSLNLGDSIRLGVVSNLPLANIAWSPASGLSCTDCREPFARPGRTTTYIATVTAPGGCTDTDTITVNVLIVRDVYVPNVFSPDDNGINDYFLIYGGPEVVQIRYMKVYSRWGELVYEKDNMQPNLEYAGWDGRYRGKELPAGVYTWVAEIVFLDGESLVYKGDVTIVR